MTLLNKYELKSVGTNFRILLLVLDIRERI